MKEFMSTPISKLGFYILVLVMSLFISLEVDKYCFGMMNASHTIAFGIGVALFTMTNMFFAYVVVQLAKKLIENYKLLKQK